MSSKNDAAALAAEQALSDAARAAGLRVARTADGAELRDDSGCPLVRLSETPGGYTLAGTAIDTKEAVRFAAVLSETLEPDEIARLHSDAADPGARAAVRLVLRLLRAWRKAEERADDAEHALDGLRRLIGEVLSEAQGVSPADD